MKGKIAIKRIYEPPSKDDGCRVLVDRLWPRGVGRDAAALDLWLKDIAPSPELREWFGHDSARFKAFRDRYWKELEDKDEAVAELRGLIRKGKVTLLYAARDELHNHARVLADYIGRQQ